MPKDFIIEQLKKKFKDREYFTRKELFDFYRHSEHNLKETTFRWRIYHLKQNRIISSLAKGVFTLAYKPIFKPENEEMENRIFFKLDKQFPDLKYCIWNTKIINEFMLHLPNRFIII